MQDLLTHIALGAGDILMRRFGTRLHRTEKEAAGFVTEADLEAEAFIIDAIQREFPDASIIAEESGETAGEGKLTWFVDPLDGTTNFAHGIPFFAVSLAVIEQGRLTHGAIFNPASGALCLAQQGQGGKLLAKGGSSSQPGTGGSAGTTLHVGASAPMSHAVLATGDYYVRGDAFDRAMAELTALYRRCRTVRIMGSVALALRDVAAGRLDGFWQSDVNAWDVAAGVLAVTEAGGVVATTHGEPFDINDRSSHRRGLVAGRKAVVAAIVAELARA